MNHRSAHSWLPRAFAGAALAASIVGAVSPASAVTCTFGFPIGTTICAQGSSSARVTHALVTIGGATKFRLAVNMTGGSLFAAAFGIDVNGNQLNKCATTSADDSPSQFTTRGVACSRLYGTAGTAQPITNYDHPVNMVGTFLLVI